MLKTANSWGSDFWRNFRCVVHSEAQVLVKGGKDVLESTKFTNEQGQEVVHFVDLRVFVDTLMFTCMSQPGLSSVFMELLSADNYSFRSVDANALGVVGLAR